MIKRFLCVLLLAIATTATAQPAAAPADTPTVEETTAPLGNGGAVAGSPVFQPGPAAGQRMGSGAPSAVANPTGLLLGTLFLLALVVGAWWLVRRMGGLQGGGTRGMRVLASLPVGTRERVVIAEIGGEQWALGVAPGRVTLLHRFDTPVISTGGGQGEDFASRMRQLLQQGLNK